MRAEPLQILEYNQRGNSNISGTGDSGTELRSGNAGVFLNNESHIIEDLTSMSLERINDKVNKIR